MRPYAAVLRAKFLTLLQYRAAALAGLVTQVFWGFIRMMIFGAFFASGVTGQPMGLADVITYVWLGQGLIILLPWRVDPDVLELVRTGNVAHELLRPVDLHSLWYSRAIALRTAPTVLRAVPLYTLALLFFGMATPPSATALLGFLLSLAAAVLLASSMTALMSVTVLWTISGRGIAMILGAAMWMFSGMILPIRFFPDWALPVIDFLPFRGVMDTPFRIYLGEAGVGQAAGMIAHQLLWTVAIVLLGRALLAAARRRIVVQGG